eukprot:9296343-Ditylum_brightwellii.AAC.1
MAYDAKGCCNRQFFVLSCYGWAEITCRRAVAILIFDRGGYVRCVKQLERWGAGGRWRRILGGASRGEEAFRQEQFLFRAAGFCY